MKKKLLVFVMLVFLATLASALHLNFQYCFCALGTDKGFLAVRFNGTKDAKYAIFEDEDIICKGEIRQYEEKIEGGYSLVTFKFLYLEVDDRVYGYDKIDSYLRKYGLIDVVDSDLNLRILLPPDFETKVYESNDCVTFDNFGDYMRKNRTISNILVNHFVCFIPPVIVEDIKSYSKEELDDFYDWYTEELKKAGYY